MKTLPKIFDANKAWAKKKVDDDAAYFERLSAQQAPRYLWIGCSDSRVPANEVCGLQPGEIFVHRNVANVVTHTDFNCLSVVQYAVEVLKVKHIIVCGHYGCGGVKAALGRQKYGLIDNWLRHIQDVASLHHKQLEGLELKAKQDLLCELNVKAQVFDLCYTTIVQDAWMRGQELNVHGWIYSLHNGLLKDLDTTVTQLDQISDIYQMD